MGIAEPARSWWIDRWGQTVAGALMVLAVGFPVLLILAFGADFFRATGVAWFPVHGYAAAIVIGALQVGAAVVFVVRGGDSLRVVYLLLGLVAAGLLARLVAPAFVPPLNSSTDPWTQIAMSGAAWGIGYLGLRGRRLLAPLGAVAAITVLATEPWTLSPSLFAFGVLFVLAPALAGLLLGYRKQYVDALRERAHRTEREQALLAEQARADERVRLAGEMHDVVTHRLSLMVLQAGALGVTASDGPTRAAAEELRAAGCQALGELRDLIGVLRSPADEQDPTDQQPGMPSLVTLVDESRAVGLRVCLAENGDRANVSPVVGRTAYRIVQEALTNVHKHAPGADAEVTVDYDRERLRLHVRNSPPSTPPHVPVPNPLADTGSGSGLTGLRRRVELVRGSLHAASTAEGGFTLDATLPAYVPTSEVPRG